MNYHYVPILSAFLNQAPKEQHSRIANTLLNLSHLAKQIKKICALFAYQDAILYNNQAQIKHVVLLQRLSKALGFKNYREAKSANHEFATGGLNLKIIDAIEQQVRLHLVPYTSKQVLDQIINMLALTLLYPSAVDATKYQQSVWRKINKTYKKLALIPQYIDALGSKSNYNSYVHDIAPKGFEQLRFYQALPKDSPKSEHQELANDFKYFFLENFQVYTKTIKKSYYYVWSPQAFEADQKNMINHLRLSDFLKKYKIEDVLKELLEYCALWVYSLNLVHFYTAFPCSTQHSYFVPLKTKFENVDILIARGAMEVKRHMGVFIFSNNDLLHKLQYEHLQTLHPECVLFLYKMTWQTFATNAFSLHFFDGSCMQLCIYSDALCLQYKDDLNVYQFELLELSLFEGLALDFKMLSKGALYPIYKMNGFFLITNNFDRFTISIGSNEDKVQYEINFDRYGMHKQLTVGKEKNHIRYNYDALRKIIMQKNV